MRTPSSSLSTKGDGGRLTLALRWRHLQNIYRLPRIAALSAASVLGAAAQSRCLQRFESPQLHHPLHNFIDVSAIGGFRRVGVRLWSGVREFRSLGGSLTALRAEFGALSPAAIFVFPQPFGGASNRDFGSRQVRAVRGNASRDHCGGSAPSGPRICSGMRSCRAVRHAG
jgi:hypothetical protein